MTWQEVYAEIEQFNDKWPTSQFGPGHLVLADDNTDDHCIMFCMAETWKELRKTPLNQELIEVMDFLVHLSQIREDERVEPEEDDDES